LARNEKTLYRRRRIAAANAGGTRFASTANKMLDVRSQSRATAKPAERSYRWGIVDVLLGILMLPFGIWLLVIEGMVRLVAAARRN